MRRHLSYSAPCLAVLLAVAVLTQPVLAAPPANPVLATPVVPAETAEDTVELWRDVVVQGMVQLDRPIEEARALVDQLTADDLRVLIQNPDMMQSAGVDWGLTLIVGAIIIGVLIAVAASGNGFISFSS